MALLRVLHLIFVSTFSILVCAASSESGAAGSQELVLLADMLENTKDLRGETVALENSIDQKDLDLDEFIKRDSNFGSSEYGWGGGRFGKRGDSDMEYGWGGGRFGKRYDPFSVGGRFGKRGGDLTIDEPTDKRYDPFSVGGRFGKRYDPFSVGGRFGKRYDPFSVGGRFGKRYDPFSVGGRFGKRGSEEDVKRYDPFSIGGRFGKRSAENDYKRYDKFSVGGRFGRDVSNVKTPTEE